MKGLNRLVKETLNEFFVNQSLTVECLDLRRSLNHPAGLNKRAKLPGTAWGRSKVCQLIATDMPSFASAHSKSIWHQGNCTSVARQSDCRKSLFRFLLFCSRIPAKLSQGKNSTNAFGPTAHFVDFDQNLNTAVKKLREALGDSAETPTFIETLPRRGYRFIAPISVNGPGTASAGRISFTA